MMWLAWRQQRFETFLGLGVFGVVALLLTLTGISMAHAYDHLGVGPCLFSSSQGCGAIRDAFRMQVSQVVTLVGWLNFVPLILGIALGAPLAMEMDAGTYRLAWTQSITRGRWLAARLAYVIAGALLVSVAFMLLMHWWRGPLDQMGFSFDPDAFDFEGPVVIAYTLFAATLVLSPGILLRRIVPVLGLSLPVFLGVRLGVEDLLRPHFMSPVMASPAPRVWQRTLGWILDSGWVNHTGRTVDPRTIFNLCSGAQSKGLALDCIQRHGLTDYVVYQPAARYWAFQGIESAIFLGISAVLVGLAVFWVRYRMN